MGCDIHITRAEDWSDNAGFEITPEEWLGLVRQDAELTPMPENGRYFVAWRGDERSPQAGFDWQAGNITTKNPDRATLAKMHGMAQRLKAQVQGDEGEVYGSAEIEAFDDHFLEGRARGGLLAKMSRWLKKS